MRLWVIKDESRSFHVRDINVAREYFKGWVKQFSLNVPARASEVYYLPEHKDCMGRKISMRMGSIEWVDTLD